MPPGGELPLGRYRGFIHSPKAWLTWFWAGFLLSRIERKVMRQKDFRAYAILALWVAGAALPWTCGLPALIAAAIITLLAKRSYDHLISDLVKRTTRDETGRVVVSLPGAPRSASELQKFEVMIDAAIREENRVAFEYQDRDGNSTIREITPWRIQNMSNGRAVTGHCNMRDGERNFYLNRMSSIRVSSERKKAAEAAQAKPNYVFGVVDSSSLDDIPF